MKLREHGRLGAPTVLQIDEEPVEAAGIGELSDGGGTGLQPSADLDSIGAGWGVHWNQGLSLGIRR
jgi:hypothetical protein